MIKIKVDDKIGGQSCPFRWVPDSPGESRCNLKEGPRWCQGLYDKDCPFNTHDRIVVRRKINGCVHLTNKMCGLELANGDMHAPLCGVAPAGEWEQCEASEYDE